MKRLLSFFVVLFATTCLWAQNNVITYTATEKLPELASATWSDYGLRANAFNVSITSHTFSNGMGTIIFSDDVVEIGDYAFRGCSSLVSIIIPNSVTSIGSCAFENCSAMTTISIPNDVMSIGYYAFNGVINIEYSGTATGSPWGAQFVNMYVEGNLVYTNSTKNYLLSCSRVATGDIVIPNTVTRIGDRAFAGRSEITSITMPNSVTKIGENAFASSGITSIQLSESLPEITKEAFSDCRSLTTITIPESVMSIGDYAFKDCFNLTSIMISGGMTSIGYAAFQSCYSLTSITIPENVTNISNKAFYECAKLTTVTIPNSVTNIGQEAFRYCFSLNSITIPSSVTSIEYEAFYNCIGLTSITFQEGLLSISSEAFYGCSALISITIPNSVRTIGNSAFYNCTNLTSIYMERTTPPSLSSRIYNGYNATLYVPCGSASAYAAAQYWDDFASIEEVGCEPSPEELSYTREDLTVGRFGTICLPKRVENEDIVGAQFYSIAFALKNTNDEITSILLDEETSGLQAGKPYLFRATATTMTLNYSGFAVETPIAANGLVGNLDVEDVNVPQGKYILSNNQLRKLAGGNATVAQNRAYIDLDNVHAYTVFPVEPSPAQVQIRVADSNPVATDIESAEVHSANKVLRDGKMLILRDNKTFDLTGRQIL